MTIILKPTLDLIATHNQKYAKVLNDMLNAGTAEMKKTKSGINYLKIDDDENYQI